MLKEEIISLKEELLKEIRDVEQKLNVQINIKSQEIEEKNSQFIEEFNLMLEKNKTLITSITSQNFYSEKITDLENFRKKTENMIITHEIRINNSIKEIKDINFKFGKEISENLNVSGFIGPSCKYKTIGNYLSTNIKESERIKTDIESNKKDNKEIKKKIEDIIKTVLNLVDRSNTKCIEYTNSKSKNIEEFINKKFEEFNDKIIGLKSSLITQEKIKEIYDNCSNNIQNNYNKKEIDDMLNNIINNFDINLDNFKTKYNEEINDLIKTNINKLDKEIKESNKSIKDIKMKITKMNQIQNQLFKRNISMRNVMNNNNNNNNEIYFNQNKNNIKMDSSYHINNNIRNYNRNEEEKQSRFRNNNYSCKNFDSFQFRIAETMTDKEKGNISNININQNTNIEKNKTDLLNISLKKIGKYKFNNNNINNIYAEGNKKDINDNENKLDLSKDNSNLSKNKNNLSYNKINSMEKEINSNSYNIKSMNSLNTLKSTKTEYKTKKSSLLLKKVINIKNHNINNNISTLKMDNYNSNNSNNHNNLSNIVSFTNQKSIVVSNETEDNNNENNNNNNDSDFNNINNNINKDNNNKIIEIINDNTLFKDVINNKKIIKRNGYSLHKLASLGFEDKANEILPVMTTFSSKNIFHKYRNPNTPIIKNVFHQNYQLNLKNDKLKQNLTIDTPVKITSSFGRTGYTFYDKREEGINNLINKGISKKIKKMKSKSVDVNLELSPVSKIKVYGNL